MKQQHTLQPKLRFPEFDGDWKKEFIKNISDFIGGGTPDTSKSEFWQGNIPWISSSDIFENEILKISVSRFINLDALNNSATKLIPKGSLLIVSRVGVGKFAIAPTDICTSQDFTNLILKEDEVNNSFLAYQLFSNKNVLLKISQGTSIKGFTSSDLKSVLVLLPSLPEQQKIADYLSTVDNKINLLEEKKAQLALYKKAMMQKLFSQEIRFKPSEAEALEAYPEWEEKRLEDVFTVTRGQVLAVSKMKINSDNIFKYPVYSSQTRDNGLTGFYDEYLYQDAITWTTDGANAGTVLFRRGKFYCTNVCGVLISHEGNSNNCIAEMINMIAKKYVSYVGNPKLMNNVMAKIKIYFPSVQEQQKIADFLLAIDESIEKVNEQITQTQSFKKAMLQQMFV